MDTQARLEGMRKLLSESNEELAVQLYHETGYRPADPAILSRLVRKVAELSDPSDVSLDLGCGNGGWALLMAAAGHASYGIEINPVLIDHAQRNLERARAEGFIATDVPCAVIQGDMIPPRYSASYDAYRRAHAQHLENMPIGAIVEDAYLRLAVNISTADIIYCWAWPTQSRFLFNMLELEAKKDAIFVLPSYLRYTQGEFLRTLEEKNTLILLTLHEDGEGFIGVRGGAARLS